MSSSEFGTRIIQILTLLVVMKDGSPIRLTSESHFASDVFNFPVSIFLPRDTQSSITLHLILG